MKLKDCQAWQGHRYSFSQLDMYEQCPLQYYMMHAYPALHNGETIVTPAPNIFSQYGLLAHSIIQRWSKGELQRQDMAATFEAQYDQYVGDLQYPGFLAMNGYAQKKYEGALEYFSTFDGFIGYKVLCGQQKMQTTINGHNFVGIMDLLLQDQLTGQLVLVDHKSKSRATFNKKKDRNHLFLQTYLYCKFIYEKYGKYPDRIRFNLFSENDYYEEDFDLSRYMQAIDWAARTIASIQNQDVWDVGPNKPGKITKNGNLNLDFFCSYLCDCREECTQFEKARGLLQ